MKIVEVGTSDFRTLAGQVDGIFIEPVPYYFNRLPQNCNKVNAAISDYEGEVKVYYMTDDKMSELGMPNWVRGCNSINGIHPTVKRLLTEKRISTDVVECATVPVMRLKTVLDKYGVTEIEFLKIDTEGHDCIILHDFLKDCHSLPKKIQFEANELTNKKEVNNMVQILADKGYKCRLVKFDMVCELL